MKKIISLTLAMLTTTTLFVGTQVLAQPAPQTAFTRADAETRAEASFARLDVNGDGQLTAADREARHRARFEAADTDKNGQLSFAEMTAAREARMATRGERRETRGERQAGNGERMGMRGMRGMGRQHIAGADANNDGAVSQGEFTAAVLARFDRADANSDGTISVEERRSMRGDRRGEGQGGWRQQG